MADEIKIIRMKRGTSTEWGSEAAPLMAGEIGYDSTLNVYKGGDGSTAFGSLPTLGAGTSIAMIIALGGD